MAFHHLSLPLTNSSIPSSFLSRPLKYTPLATTKLTKREKRVLRLLRDNRFDLLTEMDYPALHELYDSGFARVAYIEGGVPEAAQLTTFAKNYLAENPKLHNPIDWKWVITTTLAAIAAGAAVAALFVACSLT